MPDPMGGPAPQFRAMGIVGGEIKEFSLDQCVLDQYGDKEVFLLFVPVGPDSNIMDEIKEFNERMDEIRELNTVEVLIVLCGDIDLGKLKASAKGPISCTIIHDIDHKIAKKYLSDHLSKKGIRSEAEIHGGIFTGGAFLPYRLCFEAYLATAQCRLELAKLSHLDQLTRSARFGEFMKRRIQSGLCQDISGGIASIKLESPQNEYTAD